MREVDDRHLARGPPDRGRRDRPGRATAPTTAVPSTSTSAPTTPASGRRPSSRWSSPPTWSTATTPGDARVAEPARATSGWSSSRSSTSTGSSSRGASASARCRRRPERDAAAERRRPGAYRRKNCRPADPGRRRRPLRAADLGRRPEPQLRRLLGRTGLERRPDLAELSRHRALLGARVRGRAPVQLGHPPHRLHHQPHLHRATASGCASRASTHVPAAGLDGATDAGRGGDEGLGDAMAARDRLDVRARLRDARRHHRRDRGLELLRAGHLRLHARGARARTSTPTTRTWSSTSTWATRPTPGSACARRSCAAGEVAASTADHGIVEGTAPRRRDAAAAQGSSTAPTSNPAEGPATIPEDLDTTLRVGAVGRLRVAREPVEPPRRRSRRRPRAGRSRRGR